MNKQIPSYLKLVTDTINQVPAGPAEDLAGLTDVCRAFEQATGWRLEYAAETHCVEQSSLMWSAPVNPGVGTSPGHIRLLSNDNRECTRPIALDEAIGLAESLAKLWGELQGTRHALGQREAELACGVPLVVRETEEESPSLGERLEAVVRGGAEATGCQAAALYLLDEATSQLKLRSSWGLPRKRLVDPARPLRGALADLEALLGHAVVLNDSQVHSYWKVPEKGFDSCVCVPVCSPAMPLGTLWTFCREPRDFSAAQTNILEIVAGRIAVELERQVLIDEALCGREHARQMAAAARWQQEQLPVAPVVEGWDVAAKSYHDSLVGGALFDWFALADGGLSVLAGCATQSGLSGALVASGLRAAARALGSQRQEPRGFLEKANSILWTGSAGNGGAGLFQAVLKPHDATIAFAAAGALRVLVVRASGAKALAEPTTPLGLEEDSRIEPVNCKLTAGELLLVHVQNNPPEATEWSARDARLAAALKASSSASAQELVELASDVLGAEDAFDSSDAALMVIKRRRR